MRRESVNRSRKVLIITFVGILVCILGTYFIVGRPTPAASLSMVFATSRTDKPERRDGEDERARRREKDQRKGWELNHPIAAAAAAAKKRAEISELHMERPAPDEQPKDGASPITVDGAQVIAPLPDTTPIQKGPIDQADIIPADDAGDGQDDGLVDTTRTPKHQQGDIFKDGDNDDDDDDDDGDDDGDDDDDDDTIESKSAAGGGGGGGDENKPTTKKEQLPLHASTTAAASNASDGRLRADTVDETPVERVHEAEVRGNIGALGRTSLEKKQPKAPVILGDSAILDRLKRVPDLRTQECLTKSSYDLRGHVSVIMDFSDVTFHAMKVTLASVLMHNDTPELLKEIVVVDDGSSSSELVNEAKVYLSKHKLCRLVILPVRVGSSRARVAGAKTARGDILIFLSSNATVTKGWLEPLVDVINSDRSLIAVPHFDNITDAGGFEYRRLDDDRVFQMSWSLAVRMTKSPESTVGAGKIRAPVIRGDALAVSKVYYEKIGGYDEGFPSVGGENLELSLRTWLCGGTIFTVMCSRVGVLDVDHAVRIDNHASIRRIAKLWVPDHEADIFLNTGIGHYMAELEETSFQSRRDELDKLGLKCSKFQQYLDKLHLSIATPSKKAKQFGVLYVRSGQCGRVASDNRVVVEPCDPQVLTNPSPDMLFELDEDKHLKVKGQCLETKGSAYVTLEPCKAGETSQFWKYTMARHVVNEWSGLCLMHVTDPDPKTAGQRQTLMAQECVTASTDQFVQLEFVFQN